MTDKSNSARTGGQLIVDCLEAQGVDRVFCVPGESYLAVLDALHDSPIEAVVARQEGGATMMAEADGKLTGRPGIAMVTRAPGATNASSGVHVAQQDSTPMILFVGQIGRRMRGRDAFQEVDYTQFFGGMAKWVEQIDQADRIPEIISHAFHIAMSGRPGPVVLALPEDMLRELAQVQAGLKVEVAEPAPSAADMDRLEGLLAKAKKPFLVVGGSRWSEESVAQMADFARRWNLPVGASFRRQMLFDHLHPNYAGDVGLGINPKLKARIADADLLIFLGARFSENPSQSFSLLEMPETRQTLVHIHAGPEELGRIYRPDLAINATPGQFLSLAEKLDAGKSAAAPDAVAEAHQDYLDWSAPTMTTPGTLQMAEVMQQLEEILPADAIMANGAGNYATWLHRFHRFQRFGTQLAPTSGSMGYGLPAAVAGALRHPDRPVVCFAGDGCFQMTCQEFGTAMQSGANIIVLVIDNGIYGTIRMHQERDYPARISATELVNPDFVALARAYGGHAEKVERSEDFTAAFERARAAGKPALLHLQIDPEAISPATTLSKIRSASQS
ncbi:thiamine pyrophosphate-binding protein [Rhodovibrionaceae bacterium A322]